ALTGEQDSLKMMLAEYKRRRDWLIPALNKIEGISCAMPEGAFYAFPNIKGVLGENCKTSAEFARLLLHKAHVVVSDGAAFGSEGYLRMSYANSLENLQKGVERIKEAVQQIR